MGLLDLFRPKWKHSNPDVRLHAIQQLTDAMTLQSVACDTLEDERIRAAAFATIAEPSHRRSALEKITTSTLLGVIARTDHDEEIRKAAASRLRDLGELYKRLGEVKPRTIWDSIADGDLPVAKYLLSLSPSLIAERNDNGRMLLHDAAFHGHLGVVKFLVSRGAEIDALDRDGLTPLNWAFSMGHQQVAELLVRRGARLVQIDAPLFAALAHVQRNMDAKGFNAGEAAAPQATAGALTCPQCGLSFQWTDFSEAHPQGEPVKTSCINCGATWSPR